MRDLLTEIWESIRRNKLRTALTGFAVSWGLFMLIILLGAGNGLRNMTEANMGDISANTMSVYGGWTSKAFDGLEQGRKINLNAKDVELTKGDQFSDYIDDVTVEASSSTMTISLDTRYFSSSLDGVYPISADINKYSLVAGRFINDNDISGKRKVIVITTSHARTLLDGGTDYESLIGRRIKAGNLLFKVIGIRKADALSYNESAIIPYTTLEGIFGDRSADVGGIVFTFHGLETEEANEAFENSYRAVIAHRHRAAPSDTRAVRIYNQFTMNMQMDKGMNILNVALWIVGLFTLLSGIVGVSNIMLITVKERTHEFGIRKALGARPGDITKLIIAESITITAFFGYIGMVLGMFGCELMSKMLGSGQVTVLGETITVFKDPTVGLDVALEATLLLIIAGTIAGLVPSLKATRVRPIEALRAD